MKILLVLPKPSRFDLINQKILSGHVEEFVRSVFARNGATFEACYLSEYKPSTAYDRVLFTGEECLTAALYTRGLDADRGLVMRDIKQTPYTITYWPQDCVDIKDYESSCDEDEEDADGNGKDSSPTARKNYRFWFEHDLRKLIAAPRISQDAPFILCDHPEIPLSKATGQPFFFDIETHPNTDTLQCYSFACGDGPVYTVPVYDHTGKLRQSHRELAALVKAFNSASVVVAHNIAFDWLFLVLKHKMPLSPKAIYDTMLANHRIHCEGEKSLGHVISLWTNHQFHKDSAGTFHPHNWSQYERLLRYNSKDVGRLRDVYRAQMAFLATRPDYAASVAEVNEAAVLYGVASLTGFPFNPSKILTKQKLLAKRLAYVQKILNILVGYDLNAGSPKQVADYCYGKMKYDVVSRTDSGEPSVGGDVIYKLLTKHPNNAALHVIVEIRDIAKRQGSLGFKPLMLPGNW